MSADTRPAQIGEPGLEDLVAYLDGELDSTAARTVERRLAQDAQYRHQLQQLQRSWDLLDHLPKAHVDQSFTQSTVAMVVVKAEDEVTKLVTARSRRRQVAFWLSLAGAAGAFLAGYALAAWYGDRDNRRLLQDLLVIRNIDEYRYAETVEFLRALDREGLFAEEEGGDEL